MRDLLQHPAVWQGAELFDRRDWAWTLSEEERDELKELAREFPAESGPVEDLPRSSLASPRLAAKLTEIRTALEHGTGAALLRGFPLESLSAREQELGFWRLMQGVGTPVPQTANGRRLFRVQDEGLAPDHPQSRGPSSRNRLSFHTDRCDVIAFLCVRQAQQGGTNQLVSSMALYNRIAQERPDLLEALCTPYFYQRHNVDPGNENPYYQQPVFSFCEGFFAANLLRVLIERAYRQPEIGPMPARQREALDYLEQLADEPTMQATFRQEPGDVVLLNNFVTLHRRDEFVDADQPDQKRLLLRIWLAVPNSRPLDESFRGSYGETAAGAIRGGMRRLEA